MAKYKPYRYLVYLLLEAGRRVFLVVPRSWAMAFASLAGSGAYGMMSQARSRTREHLSRAFGPAMSPEEVDRTARRTFIYMARTAVDVARFPLLNRQRIEKLVVPDGGLGKLDQALRQGKGVIALTGHIGNWELLASYFRFLGYPGSLVGRKIYYEPYNRVLVCLRKSALVSTIYHDDHPKVILGELKANHMIGMSADQDIDRMDGMFLEFFGRPAWTPAAPAKVSLASGAPIVPMFMLHEGGRYRLLIEDPIWPVKDRDKEAAVRLLTESWSKVVEGVVRRTPDQWAWIHNRWKTTPAKLEWLKVEKILNQQSVPRGAAK